MTRSKAQRDLAAVLEARRAHAELGIDISRRIDPFMALEQSGVLVMRQPLERLAGAYLPGDETEGSMPGVLVNADHPLSRQRYTAAHELSHHRRDRQLVLDVETEWLARGGSGASPAERFAETFAAWFLMPKSLVVSTLDGLGFGVGNADRLGASDVYTLSLELGTSYAATLHHLAAMKMIPDAQRRRLARVSPKNVKQMIGGAGLAADAWKDVHLIRLPRLDAVGALAGDAVVVEITEVPSSGYLWRAVQVPTGLALVRDEFQPGGPDVLGGQGEHRFLFRVDSPGHQPLHFELVCPWRLDAAAEREHLEIVSEPEPTPGLVHPEALVSA